MDDQVHDMILARLDSIDAHLEKQSNRLSKLEIWRGFLTGVTAVISGMLAWLFKVKTNG